MTDAPNGKLSDLKTPEVAKIELSDGRVALLGSMTMDVVYQVEEAFGTFGEWQKVAMSDDPKLSAILDMIWFICQNQEEFGHDKRNLMRGIQISRVHEFQGVLGDVLKASMPEAQKGTGKKGKAASKSRGQSTSAP